MEDKKYSISNKEEEEKKKGMKNRQHKYKTKRTIVNLKTNTLMITLNITEIL